MAGNLEINSNLDIYGSLKLSSVPNQIGTLLTYNESTREVGGRSYNDIINDLNLNGYYAKIDGSNVVANSIWNMYSKGIYGAMPAQSASDYYRIIGLDEGSDAGALEIATSDNGDEPIYVRQYSYLGGSGTGVDLSFGTIIRSATLLGRDGNTSFPEIVTAKSFSWFNHSVQSYGIVTTYAALYNIGSNYAYGISTNVGGGLDIMSNQSGQPIRFWAGGDNTTPTLSAIFNGSVATFTGKVRTATDFIVDTNDGNFKGLIWETNSVRRWYFYTQPNQESGGNSGSDLLLARYADNGDYLGNIFRIYRNTGEVRFNDNLSTESYGNAQLWYQAYLATQNLSNDYVKLDGTSTMTGTLKTPSVRIANLGSGNANTRHHYLSTNANVYGDFTIFSTDFNDANIRYDLTIDTVGNVGIGRLNPIAKLHVNGNTFTDGYTASTYGLTIMQIDGTGHGIALYGSVVDQGHNPSYGLMFATTYNYGTMGSMNGDWATYFTMDGATNRGWVFRHKSVGNVASINGEGYISTLYHLGSAQWYEAYNISTTLQNNIGDYLPKSYGNTSAIAAYYKTSAIPSSGSLFKIRLPYLITSNVMIAFTIRVYQDYRHFDIAISGYLYDTYWYIPTAKFIVSHGNGWTVPMDIVFGVDPDSKAYVSIPMNNYMGIAILDVVLGYAYGSDAGIGWELIPDNTTPNITTTINIEPLNRLGQLTNDVGFATEAWVKNWGLGTYLPNYNINIDSARETGFYGYFSGTSSGTSPFGYASLIHVNFGGSTEFSQIAIRQGAVGLAFRNESSNWYHVYHEGNFSPQNYVNRSGDSMSGRISYANNGLANAGFLSDITGATGVGGYARSFAQVTANNAKMHFGFFGGSGNITYSFLGEGDEGWNNPTIRFRDNRTNIGHYSDASFFTNAVLTVGSREVRMYTPTWGHLQDSPIFSLRGDDGTYGTSFGVDSASGGTWIQALRYDANAGSYNINLQPVGGKVTIWKDYLNPSGDALETYGRIITYGNEQNHVMTWQSVTGVDQIVAGHEYRWYTNYWKIGNKRDGSAGTRGFSFELNGVEKALIDTDGFITVRGMHSPAFLNNFGNSQVINAGGTTLYIGNPSLTDIVIEGVGYGSLHYYSTATGKQKIFHAANLQFGSGLSYDGTTLSASGGGGVPDYLYGWNDTRNTDTIPDDYNGVFRAYGIKDAGIYGLSGGYVSVFGYRGWSDSSGGRAIEFITCDDDNIYYRKGDTNGWDATQKIYTDLNLQFGSGLNNNNGMITLASAPTRIRGGSAGVYIGGDISLEAGTAMAIQQTGQSIILHSSDTTYSAGLGLYQSGNSFNQQVIQNGSGNAVVSVTQTTNGFQVNYGSIVASVPIATTTVLGGVKDGNGVNIAADGTLSVSVGSSGSGTFVTSISQTTTGISYTMGTMSVGVTAVSLNLNNLEGINNSGSTTITSSGTFSLNFDTGYSLVKPADRTLLDKLTRQATTQNYTNNTTSAQTLNSSVGNHRIYRSLGGCVGMLLHITPQDGDRITIHGYQFGGLQIRNGVGWAYQNIYTWESSSPVTNFYMVASCMANPNTTCTLVYRGSLTAWVVEAMHY